MIYSWRIIMAMTSVSEKTYWANVLAEESKVGVTATGKLLMQIKMTTARVVFIGWPRETVLVRFQTSVTTALSLLRTGAR